MSLDVSDVSESLLVPPMEDGDRVPDDEIKELGWEFLFLSYFSRVHSQGLDI